MAFKTMVIRAGLEGVWLSGAHRLARPVLGGRGLIFTLHHVLPARVEPFQPNRLLEVTPEFLDGVLDRLRRRGIDLVTLDEAMARLAQPHARPFAALTFDDGYQDVARHALPILRKHGAPATLYIPTDFPDGRGVLWWRTLEQAIATHTRVAPEAFGLPGPLATATTAQKRAAYRRLYGEARALSEHRRRAAMEAFAEAHGIDQHAVCRAVALDWEGLRTLARDPLITIGAHTMGHVALATLPPEEARRELAQGAARLAETLGSAPRHLSYPYGAAAEAGPREFALAAELGFATAVTTRPGVLFADHGRHPMALPRVSLNGEHQALRYVDVFLSGLPFYVWNGGRRLAVA